MPCTFSTSQLPKVIRDRQFLTLLTSKCASRHNGLHFFDISTSKSAPRPPVFNTFDFEMCFTPQRRALFQHLNFQKWSDAEVFCTFSLRNRLRATTACNFSSLISPDVSAPAGGWGPTASATWKKLWALRGACIGLTASQGVEQLLQALSVALQRENARAVLRRLPPADDVSCFAAP